MIAYQRVTIIFINKSVNQLMIRSGAVTNTTDTTNTSVIRKRLSWLFHKSDKHVWSRSAYVCYFRSLVRRDLTQTSLTEDQK